MRRILCYTLSALLICAGFCACNDDETYAEKKEKERKAINSFLQRDVAIVSAEGDTVCHVGRIHPISEKQFREQDSITNLENNEYVLFKGTGVYMQIVRKGPGEKMKSGDNKQIICRYWEYNIMGDSLQSTNRAPYWIQSPDIIDVSNMEVGAFNFHFGDVDVDTLCKEKMEDAKEFLPAGVEYLYAPSMNGLHLQSDPKRVGQVLHNLLTNACKNTTTGSITLGVRHNAAKDSIEFVVTDTGCGIPPDKTDVIFEHFEKLDHYSPGLGLGLYVCRLIARALGGDIYLDTEYTTGARFVFTVPNHTAPQEEESQAANGEETQKYGVSHASLQL